MVVTRLGRAPFPAKKERGFYEISFFSSHCCFGAWSKSSQEIPELDSPELLALSSPCTPQRGRAVWGWLGFFPSLVAVDTFEASPWWQTTALISIFGMGKYCCLSPPPKGYARFNSSFHLFVPVVNSFGIPGGEWVGVCKASWALPPVVMMQLCISLF